MQPRIILLLCFLVSVAFAAVSPPPVTGRFPISFRNPKGTLTSPIPAFSWCNDKRQLDGATSCGDFTSKMRWGNAGFAPANCNPTPGASGFNLKPVGDNADGAAILIVNGSPETIAHFQHINFLIHENPGMAVNIHASVNIAGLEELDAQWNIRHDETTNWFLSNSCNSATWPGCCGAACQSTTCSNCMTKFPNFCPYGGSPCIVGCNDGVGFTTDYPLKYTWQKVKHVGTSPDILPNCDYNVSVWWGSLDTSISKLRSGTPVNGVFITKEGQDNTAPLLIQVTATCARTCPPCSPCEECVNFQCVPKCNDPCAPCVNGACAPVKCTDKCTACSAGQCVPTTLSQTCDACSICDSSTGNCKADTTLCASDLCFQCNPNDNGACTLPRNSGCSACEVCNATNGQCNDAQLCDKCSVCALSTESEEGYVCQAKSTPCPSCQDCVPEDGSCMPRACENLVCEQCNPTTDQCEVQPERPCGANTECNWCDATGACVARTNATCTLEDNDACKNPLCTEAGECVLTTDTVAVGTPCATNTSECTTHLCGQDGTCEESPLPEETPCTLEGIDPQCQESQCSGDGACVAISHPAGTSCALEGIDPQCQVAVCSADGQCVATPVADIECTLVDIDPQCQKATCSADGACVVMNLEEGLVCNPPAEEANDRNKTLCRSYTCAAGRCITQPLREGSNCTHRKNESDLSERICELSYCSGDGLCLSNGTLPVCMKKNKAKIGIIIGVIAGVAALVIAGVIAAYFIAGRGTAPLTAGEGVEYMNAGLLENPIYANNPAAGSNPMYNEDM